MQRRLRDAAADMTHGQEFDYVVVNEDVESAVADLEAIVAGHGEVLRRDRPDRGALATGLTTLG